MKALSVILIITAVLLIISLIKIEITAEYKNKLKLIIKVLFIKKVIVKKFNEEKTEQQKKKEEKKPQKKKQKKPKKGKKQKTENPKKENKSPFRKFFEQQGISGLIEIVKQLLILIKGTFRYFFKHFKVHKLVVRITVAEDEASKTAINYGRVSAVVYPLIGQLAYALDFEEYKVNVLCDFDEGGKSNAYLYMYGSVRIIFLIVLALKAAVRALKTYLKLKFNR